MTSAGRYCSERTDLCLSVRPPPHLVSSVQITVTAHRYLTLNLGWPLFRATPAVICILFSPVRYQIPGVIDFLIKHSNDDCGAEMSTLRVTVTLDLSPVGGGSQAAIVTRYSSLGNAGQNPRHQLGGYRGRIPACGS